MPYYATKPLSDKRKPLTTLFNAAKNNWELKILKNHDINYDDISVSSYYNNSHIGWHKRISRQLSYLYEQSHSKLSELAPRFFQRRNLDKNAAILSLENQSISLVLANLRAIIQSNPTYKKFSLRKSENVKALIQKSETQTLQNEGGYYPKFITGLISTVSGISTAVLTYIRLSQPAATNCLKELPSYTPTMLRNMTDTAYKFAIKAFNSTFQGQSNLDITSEKAKSVFYEIFSNTFTTSFEQYNAELAQMQTPTQSDIDDQKANIDYWNQAVLISAVVFAVSATSLFYFTTLTESREKKEKQLYELMLKFLEELDTVSYEIEKKEQVCKILINFLKPELSIGKDALKAFLLQYLEQKDDLIVFENILDTLKILNNPKIWHSLYQVVKNKMLIEYEYSSAVMDRIESAFRQNSLRNFMNALPSLEDPIIKTYTDSGDIRFHPVDYFIQVLTNALEDKTKLLAKHALITLSESQPELFKEELESVEMLNEALDEREMLQKINTYIEDEATVNLISQINSINLEMRIDLSTDEEPAMACKDFKNYLHPANPNNNERISQGETRVLIFGSS